MSRGSPTTMSVSNAIGKVTFTEIVRDKILYNILLCAALLMAIGFLASRLTFIAPDRVILDFGLSAVNLSCSMIAIFTGSSLLAREIDRRTIYLVLSHPVSRMQFVVGKLRGMTLVLAANWAILSAVFVVILGFSSPSFTSNYTPTLFLALVLFLVQSFILAAVAMLISTLSTTSLTAVMTIGVYLIGNNISQIRALAERMKSPALAGTFNAVASFLPNFEYLNLGTRATYGLPVTFEFCATAFGHSFATLLVTVLIAGLLIRWREI